MSHNIEIGSDLARDRRLVGGLLAAALTAFDRDQTEARRFVERARAVALGVKPEPMTKGGLADWQLRRVERYIDDNINTALRIGDVSEAIRLSAGHFSRTFKSTKGVSYSEYVALARIDFAKKLLLTTVNSIAGIASDCGLADQSHLTRLFSKIAGVPPGAWRRQHIRKAAIAS